jgi:transcriptional regulator with XRE-family HTH domain
MKMTVAERIKKARKAAGVTQKELGKRMGVSDASIAQYESGERNPKYDTLQRIADALGVKVGDLLPSAPYDGEVRIFTSKEQRLQHIRKLKGLFDDEADELEKAKLAKKIVDILRVEEITVSQGDTDLKVKRLNELSSLYDSEVNPSKRSEYENASRDIAKSAMSFYPALYESISRLSDKDKDRVWDFIKLLLNQKDVDQ